MLLPVTSPVAANGQQPIPAADTAAMRAQLSQINQAAAKAKFAVLGYCTGPGTYADGGLNLVTDIAQSDNPLSRQALRVVPGATSDGAGGYSVPEVFTGPEVVAMGATGLPAPPIYPPLTTSQGPSVPPGIPGSIPATQSCQLAGSAYSVLPAGAAAWGNASTSRVPASIGRFSPGVWLVLGAIGLAVLGSRK